MNDTANTVPEVATMKRWRPNRGETYYCVNSAGQAKASIWLASLSDEFAYSIGNVHKTEEEVHTYVDILRRVASPQSYVLLVPPDGWKLQHVVNLETEPDFPHLAFAKVYFSRLVIPGPTPMKVNVYRCDQHGDPHEDRPHWFLPDDNGTPRYVYMDEVEVLSS